MKKGQGRSKEGKKRGVGRPVEGESGILKDRILDAYIEICSTEGIETVTLQKVADRSGVALTSVRYHFQMKGLSLSQVALDYLSEKTFEFFNVEIMKARAEPGFDPVRAYVQIHFDWIERLPLQASFLFYYYYLSTTKVPLELTNKQLVEIAHQRIRGLVHEGLGMKLYQYEGDTLALAREIQMIVLGGCLNFATVRNIEFAKQQKETCLKLVMQLLGL